MGVSWVPWGALTKNNVDFLALNYSGHASDAAPAEWLQDNTDEIGC